MLGQNLTEPASGHLAGGGSVSGSHWTSQWGALQGRCFLSSAWYKTKMVEGNGNTKARQRLESPHIDRRDRLRPRLAKVERDGLGQRDTPRK